VAGYTCCEASQICLTSLEICPGASDAAQSDALIAPDASADDGGSTGLDAPEAPDVPERAPETSLPDAPFDASDASDGGGPPDADAGPCVAGGYGHTGTWIPMAPSPLLARNDPIMVWGGAPGTLLGDGLPDGTGNGGLLVWGGRPTNGAEPFYTDGAYYTPRSDHWTLIVSDAGPPPLFRPLAVFTGFEVLVLGYTVDVKPQFYALGGSTWSPRATPTYSFLELAQFATWTGSKMLVISAGTGAAYTRATDSWSLMSTVDAPCAMAGSAVWTGTQWILWGGDACQNMEIVVNIGAAYDPSTDTWTPLPMVDVPSPRSGHTAVWTGKEMIVWGGYDMSGQPLYDGGAYNPATQSWRKITGAPSVPATGVTGVGSRYQMTLWDGYIAGDGGPFAQGSEYDVCGWWQMPTMNQPSPRMGASSVWTGAEMIVWGGGEPSNAYGTGARFVP
jgi:hypothetical protein